MCTAGRRSPRSTAGTCSRTSALGTLQAIRVQPGGSVEHLDLGASLPDISSFGADAAGELYVTSLDGGVYRITRG